MSYQTPKTIVEIFNGVLTPPPLKIARLKFEKANGDPGVYIVAVNETGLRISYLAYVSEKGIEPISGCSPTIGIDLDGSGAPKIVNTRKP